MNLEEVITQLTGMGLAPRLSLTVEVPAAYLLEQAAPARPVASMKTVMWVLNQLKAAPGQPNRNLLRHFLFSRGWIEGNEEVEQWKLEFVPLKKSDLAHLASEIRQFEHDNKKPVHG